MTYKLFQDGETTGVFQFESSGMKRYLRDLKPTIFEDIIAMVALYRPGPMEWIPDYINGKHARKKVVYLHPKLAPILEKTYGVAIYQEQVMQIARDLAGFTMGKKIASLLAEQKEKFIEGCVKKGIYKEMAEKVFSFIEPFAGYGFNRSHAACYALIGYQTAYLKAHWPVEFMAALLSSDQGDSDRVAIEIEECRSMGIKIMAPDINESFASFTVVTARTKDNVAASSDAKVDTIRFGLNAIKNVGEHIVEMLIKERKENGPYQNIFDLLERITDRDLNKKSLESLIKSGALDNYEERGKLLANTERLLSLNKEIAKSKDNKQTSLFADLPLADNLSALTLNDAPPAEQNEKLIWEKELLGLYVSEHPFNFFRKYLNNYAIPLALLKLHKGDSRIITAGVIGTVKKILTRKGESMLFVKIEDAILNVELLIFPRLLKESAAIWQAGNTIILDGTISEKDQDLKILVNRVALLRINEPQKSIDEFKRIVLEGGPAKNRSYYQKDYSTDRKNSQSDQLEIKKEQTLKKSDEHIKSSINPLKIIFLDDLSQVVLEKLKECFLRYPGEEEVYFKVIDNGKAKIIKTAYRVDNGKKLRDQLKNDFVTVLKIVEN